MPNDLTDTIKAAARGAMKAPAPFTVRKKPEGNRDDWRASQELHIDGKYYLPSEAIIHHGNDRGWAYYSPFQDGSLKPMNELNELATKLKPYDEKIWIVLGEKDTVLGVILDGSEHGSPYLMVGADKPGQHVTIDGAGKKVTFKGARMIGGADGTVVTGDTLTVATMPSNMTLRCHDKGGSCAVRNSDREKPLYVKISGKCEMDRCNEPVHAGVTLNGEAVDMKPAVKPPVHKPGIRR